MATLPEINILLLGETGVGKSTWLNSFCNYLTHPSLAAAKSAPGPLLYVIPTQFTITTEDFTEVVIHVGEETSEENLKTGESATQTAKIHTFQSDSNVISFIDTPGIGDSRGIIKDGENMESVMKVIGPLRKLHGICILLKPNEARLTLSFRFCIQELLGHLHKDAIPNILFCFTNTRGNFYRPGESIKALRQLVANNLPGRSSNSLELNPKTIFCFDSEAFRHLAAVKQEQGGGGNFDFEAESSLFEQSWTKSSDEARRMIDQIKSLTPHNLDITLDLFRLRRYVDAITIPVVELKQKLKLEIHKLEKAREDAKIQQDLTTASVSNVMKKSTMLQKHQPGHINVVCTHDDCSTLFEGQTGVDQRDFEKICHSPCTCLPTGIQLLTQNESKLLQCQALSSGAKCAGCNHPWQIHVATNYETKIVTEKQFNSEGTADLLINFGKTVWKRSESAGIESRVTELKQELQTIQSATSELVNMLRENAIDDVNDAVEEYMDRLIKDAKTGSDELSALEELRESYGIKKEAFTELGTGSDSILNMEKVDNLIESLVSLKVSGDVLRNKLNHLVGVEIGGKVWESKNDESKDKCNIC